MGGICKLPEINEYVTGPVWGKYTGYEWFVICLSQKEGAYYFYTVSEDVQILIFNSKALIVMAAWQNLRHSDVIYQL